MPPLPQLTPCTPTEPDLYLVNSLATAVSEPDLYRLPTLRVPNLISLFHCLSRTKGSVQARGTCICFVPKPFFSVKSCKHHAQPPSWKTTLVGCPQLLIQYIRSYPPYWWPFLHPQTRDASCRDDRDLLNMYCYTLTGTYFITSYR